VITVVLKERGEKNRKCERGRKLLRDYRSSKGVKDNGVFSL
jgi:hypothetical protein